MKFLQQIPFINAIGVEVIQTLLLGLVFYVVASLLLSAATKNLSLEVKRFWRLTVRNVAIAGFVLGLAVIWRAELQAVILALGAAAAGFLIGFKEQWQSLLGFWVRVVKRQYGLNDFIEIDGVRGRVIDITWLTTTLAELGGSKDDLSYSGRVVHIPNARMLMANLVVENLTGHFSVHTIEVHCHKTANALKAENLLRDIAIRHCERYYEAAEKHMKQLQMQHSLDTPRVAPRTRLYIGNEGAITILVRIVVPFAERAHIEQAILHEFLLLADDDAWPRKNIK